MSATAELLLRWLRQRRELGESELLLDALDAREAEALLLRAMVPPAPAATRAAAAGGAPRVRAAGPAGQPPSAAHAAAADVARELAGPAQLAAVAAEAAGCTRCRLAETRTQVVFGDGDPAADVVVVGEAPGAEEDRTGLPFVGPAGKLLDLLLLSAGFPRERVYICNVLKCRPPQNRNPMADEIASCAPYLRAQLELIQPRVLLAVGKFAGQMLLGSDESMGRLRGRVREYRGVPVVATYHPAFLLRSPQWVRTAWEDFQLLRRVHDEGA